jgi:hypothetical protein
LVVEPAGPETPLRVEFAEEDTDKHVVRPVRTQARLDITKELEKLRTMSASGPSKPAPGRDREMDRLFQDLMVSDREARPEVKRQAAVEVPGGLLKGPSDVRIHLAFTQDGKEEVVVEDAVTLKLAGTKGLERLTLHLDLELKGKG